MAEKKMTATEFVSQAVSMMAPVIGQDVVISVMPDGNTRQTMGKERVLSFEISRRDLCLIEMALDAYQDMQAESGQWACDPNHLRDAWSKLGSILLACGLDYDDLKEKTDD